MQPTAKHDCDHREHPTYWFAILEIARGRDDSELMERAQRELLRLGVVVAYQERVRKAVTA
jgi:hypothetical protein